MKSIVIDFFKALFSPFQKHEIQTVEAEHERVKADICEKKNLLNELPTNDKDINPTTDDNESLFKEKDNIPKLQDS